MEINISEHYILYYFDPLMREFRSKAQQYGGEHILLYKKEISSIPELPRNFAVTTRSA